MLAFFKLIPIKIWSLLGIGILGLGVFWGISNYGGKLAIAQLALEQAQEAVALQEKNVATQTKLTRELDAKLVKINTAHVKLKQKLSKALNHELSKECLDYRVPDYVEQLRKRARRANKSN